MENVMHILIWILVLENVGMFLWASGETSAWRSNLLENFIYVWAMAAFTLGCVFPPLGICGLPGYLLGKLFFGKIFKN